MNFEMEYVAATRSLERLSALSNNSSEEALPLSPLDLDGFKMAMDLRSSLRYLQENAFQHFMACREEELVVEDDSPHGKNSKVKNDRRHPHGVEWMWGKSERLVSHLQIYDTGQQEAKLRWLLLREFGHHGTYPFPRECGRREIGMALASWGSKECGCIMMM